MDWWVRIVMPNRGIGLLSRVSSSRVPAETVRTAHGVVARLYSALAPLLLGLVLLAGCGSDAVSQSPSRVADGEAWTTRHSPAKADLTSISFTDDQHGWVVGRAGTVIATKDGGVTWRRQRSGTNQPLYGVAFADARHGWAVGWAGTVIATKDGGVTWRRQRSGTGEPLHGVAVVDARLGWVVGGNDEEAVILHTVDGGGTWATQRSGKWALQLNSVAFGNRDDGCVVGHTGSAFVTDNGGKTWTEARAPLTSVDLLSVSLSDAKHGYAVGGGYDLSDEEVGTILATVDGGHTWVEESSGVNRSLLGVCFASGTSVWAVGESGTIVTATVRAR